MVFTLPFQGPGVYRVPLPSMCDCHVYLAEIRVELVEESLEDIERDPRFDELLAEARRRDRARWN